MWKIGANRGCEVTACACGVRSPYSSVVEHPLSKRKVGSSILPGGIDIRRPRTDEVVCFLSWSRFSLPLLCHNIVWVVSMFSMCANVFRSCVGFFILDESNLKWSNIQQDIIIIFSSITTQTPISWKCRYCCCWGGPVVVLWLLWEISITSLKWGHAFRKCYCS